MSQQNYEFKYHVEFSAHPTNHYKILVRPVVTVSSTSKESDLNKESQPQHIVFVIDKSGSMADDNKIDYVKNAVKKFITNYLKNSDTFSVIAFSGVAEVVVPPTIKEQADRLAIFEKIDQIKADGATAIQAGLALVDNAGLANCKIILLTDGKNTKKIDVEEEVQTLARRCGTKPRIIPIGIGVDYEEGLLKKFGEETGINTVIHITNADAVNQAFNLVKALSGERSQPITIQVALGGSSESHNLGTLGVNDLTGWVFEFATPKGNPLSLILKSSSTEHTEEIRISQNQAEIKLNRDVIAHYVNQRIAEIDPAEVEGSKSEVLDYILNLLEHEILPLLDPERQTDSEHVKTTLLTLKGTIDAYKNGDENERRNASSTARSRTVVSSGVRSKVARSNFPKMGYQYVDNDENKITLSQLNISATLISQTLDYVAFAGSDSQYLISVDAEPGQREAILINTQSENIEPLAWNLSSLEDVVKAVQKTFPVSHDTEKRVQRIVDSAESTQKLPNQSLTVVKLDDFINKKAGLCRHIAPLSALLLTRLINTGILAEGTIRQFRGTSSNGKLAHTWIVYKPRSGDHLYLIDTTSKHCLYDLTEQSQLAQMMLDYAERGLIGVLDGFLSIEAYRTFQIFRDQAPIDPDLLNLINDEDKDFEDFHDPIQGFFVMAKPVRIAGEDTKHVFDETTLKESFKFRQINPLTGKACSNILIPAVDVRDKIILKITEKNGGIPVEKATNPAESQLTSKPLPNQKKQALKEAATLLSVAKNFLNADHTESDIRKRLKDFPSYDEYQDRLAAATNHLIDIINSPQKATISAEIITKECELLKILLEEIIKRRTICLLYLIVNEKEFWGDQVKNVFSDAKIPVLSTLFKFAQPAIPSGIEQIKNLLLTEGPLQNKIKLLQQWAKNKLMEVNVDRQAISTRLYETIEKLGSSEAEPLLKEFLVSIKMAGIEKSSSGNLTRK